MKRALITFAGGRLGVGVARALKAAPEPIDLIGVDADVHHLQRAVTPEKFLVPRASDKDYLAHLNDIVRETKADFVWVNHEAEIALISKNIHLLEAPTFLPSSEAVSLCQDKMASYERFRQAGVPVPTSILIKDELDLKQAFATLGPELWVRAIHGAGGKGSLPVSSLETAKRWIDFHQGWGNFMAAPRLSPDTITWESIWDHGTLIAAQGRKRLYWELSSLTFSGVTGVGGAHRWVSDAKADDIALQAIRAVAPTPHGVFSVDMTYDWGGEPLVTEINGGRFMSGGIIHMTAPYNLAYITLQAALGLPPSIKLPLLNPLPPRNILIHGVDIEPVLVDVLEIERSRQDFERRKASLSANGLVASARSQSREPAATDAEQASPRRPPFA